jgi:hypothetical protein
VPSLRAAVGALLAGTTQGGSGLEGLRVVYPQGYLPLPEGPAEATEGAPFEIALRANMIPPPGPVFRPSTSFVWEVYSDVLDAHRLVPTGGPGEDLAHAGQFAAAQARFGDGRVTLTDFDYYPVDLLPSDLSDASTWTRVTLTADRIAALSTQLPDHVSAWLARFNLLDELGDDLVDSVSLDVATVSVLRSWLDPDVFSWPFWDIEGELLSDGADPAVGRLPGYVTTFLAARQLVVRLGPAELPPVGPRVVFRVAPGAVGPASAPPSNATEALITMSGAFRSGVVTDRPDASSPRERLAAMVTSEVTPVGGYLKFHVPISFDISLALEAAQARLATAQAARASIDERGAAVIDIRDHRGPVVVETHESGFDHWPALRAELAAAQETERLKADQVAVLTQIGAPSATRTPYVLAIGCAVVPRCPHRDTPSQ